MKLRKRLPESRSQKKERLATEREQATIERNRFRQRKAAWTAYRDLETTCWRIWKSAWEHRLMSESAYATFERIHLAHWDLIRHIGAPPADFVLNLQRLRDGRPADLDPLVAQAVTLPLGPPELLRVLQRAPLTDDHKAALGTALLALVDLPYWHRRFPQIARFARCLDSPTLRAALTARLPNPRAALVLSHIAPTSCPLPPSPSPSPMRHGAPRGYPGGEP